MEEKPNNVLVLPQSKEESKEVFVGNTGNTAEVIEESRSPRTEHAKASRDLVRRAGEMHCPVGATYLGSASIHYFSIEGMTSMQPQFFVACQVDVGKVVEGHADIGWKQLQKALMQSYGRNEPKRRKK